MKEYRVRCDGKLHRVLVMTSGALAFPDHEGVAVELEVAETLMRLGGLEPTGCAGFLHYWRRNNVSGLTMLTRQYVRRPMPKDRPRSLIHRSTESEFLSVMKPAETARKLLLRSLLCANPQLKYVVVVDWFSWHKAPPVLPDVWPHYLLITVEPEAFMRCFVRGYNLVRLKADGSIRTGLRLLGDRGVLVVLDGYARGFWMHEVEPVGKQFGLLRQYDVEFDRRVREFFRR